MMPLSELTGHKKRGAAITDFKARVYYRGAVPTKTNQRAISERIIQEEEARGFKTQGVFRKRMRHFVDGVAIGNRDFIREQIERLREQGQYTRRRHPIEQMGGIYLSLRAQRDTMS